MSVTSINGDDGSNTLVGGAGQDLIYGFNPAGPQSQASTISATRVATGLSSPLFAVAPPNDPSRLFLLEKGGTIKILDLTSGQVLPTPFLTLTVDSAGERGLLGLAFDPDFANNGFFYVNFNNPAGTLEVRRFHVASNSNVADVTSTPILSIPLSGATNHNGGWIGFGPDGYLYDAVGENAAPSNSQTLSNDLGKILRLDVSGAGAGFAIPPDNPFVGMPGALGEIWALGLRNPWRPSFDRALGDMFIADVGQSSWEEINIGISGANYGWPISEGPGTGPFTFPIFAYDHTVGQSITGGYAYRGDSEGLQGQYFFGDFSAGKIFTLRFDGGAWVATDRTARIIPDGGVINNPSSFGEDA